METQRNSSDSPTHHHSKQIKTTHQIQTSSDGEVPNLPEEIIVEILTRLPVKSLLRFRCVCKSWFSLISSPQFIKSHLRISTKDASFSKYRVMLTLSDLGFDLKHCSLRSLIYEPLTEAFNIEEHVRGYARVVGSSNGLICIATRRKDLFLWNPSIRRKITLPPVRVKMNPGLYQTYGFCYNESADDYKVLSIYCYVRTSDVYVSVACLYSLKTNSWKRIGDLSGAPRMDGSGKYAGGKLHFLAIRGHGLDISSDIVFLDLETETYGMVEQPNYGDGQFDSTLGVLGGCISVVCSYRCIRTDLWILKEHGIKDSWTKLVTIPCINVPHNFIYPKLLFMLPNGELLLSGGVHLVVYSPKDNCLRHPKISDIRAFLGADVYVESLVSPAASEDEGGNVRESKEGREPEAGLFQG